MEKTVTVSYQEYQSLVDKVHEQEKMLNELRKGSTIIKRGKCSLYEMAHGGFELAKDDYVYSSSDLIESIIKENIELKEKNDSLKVSLNLAQDQIQEMLSDILKIPAFVRRLFGVK